MSTRRRKDGHVYQVVHIELTPGQHLAMKKLALDLDKPVSKLYRMAVSDFIASHSKRPYNSKSKQVRQVADRNA